MIKKPYKTISRNLKKERKTFQPPMLNNKVVIEIVDQGPYIDNSIVSVDSVRTTVAVYH